MRRVAPCAFSLIEVVIAIGVFATAMAIILALLPSIGGQAASAADSLVAQRLPDPLRVEMQRLAGAGGFDALAARAPVAASPLGDGLAFVAARNGAQLHSLDYLPPVAADALPLEEQYFLVEIWRFPSAPLAYDAAGAVLPVMVRVSWPYRTAGSSNVVPRANRTELNFNASILR